MTLSPPRPALFLLTFMSMFYAVQAYAVETLVTIPTRDGVTLSYMRMAPRGTPVAVAVLLPGGAGKLATWKDGNIRKGGNFVIRTRNIFAAGGMVAVALDVPSDRRKSGLKGFRGSRKYRTDLKILIRHLRRIENLPVWLVGTSRGTVGAAFAGHMLKPERGDGVVLTSSLTVGSGRYPVTVFDAPLARIAVPVLVVHHKDDGCHVTPYGDAPRIVKRLTGARVTELLTFRGGDEARGRQCGARSVHGFLGIEYQVVNAITGWMRRQAIR